MRIASLLPLCALLFVSVAQAHGNPPGHSHPPGHGDPPGRAKDETISLAQLHGPARILRDVDGMPHIYAFDEHDALFLQGWVQAQDRLFQIDVLRRQASGTLAELLGSDALPSDIELRTIGLARGAERSLAAYSPATRAGLQAYADGVNAWVAAQSAADPVRGTPDHQVQAVDGARLRNHRQGACVPAVVRSRRRRIAELPGL